MNFTLIALLTAVGLFLGILVFLEIGRRIGVMRLTHNPDGLAKGGSAAEGAVFALLGLFAIIYYFREKLYKKKDIIFFLYFLVLAFSLIYSNNLKYGFRYLEAQLPFFYLPFAYLVFSRRQIIDEQTIKKWISFFNLSNLLFLLSFVFYFLLQSQEVSYNNIRTSFDTMPLLGIHPIYLSIIAVLTIFSNFYSQNKSKVIH